MQITFDDQTVRSNTVQDFKNVYSQSLGTLAKKGKKLVSMMLAIKKTFDIMGDDIVEYSTKIESFQYEIGSYDKKWLEESKAKLLKQTDDEKRAILIMPRMQKQMKKR